MLQDTCPVPTGEPRDGRHRSLLLRCCEVLNNMIPECIAEHFVLHQVLLGLREAAGQHLDLHLLALLIAQVVDIDVCALRGHDLILDAVKTCRKHAGERQVRVAHRVRAAELRAGTVAACSGNTDQGRTVCGTPGDVTRSFVAGNKALVRVDGRVCDPGDCLCMLQETPDIIEGGVGD